MFRRLFKLIVLLVCLGVVAIGVTAGLLATESGSRWLVQRVIDYNNIPLAIGSMHGRLLDKISFHDVQYRDRNGNEIRTSRIDLDWTAGDLLALHLNINSITVDETEIKFAAGETAGPPKIPAIDVPALPVTVNIGKLQINNTRIPDDGGELHIEHILLSLALSADRLELRIKEVQSADQQLNGTATLARKKTPELDVDLRWQGNINGKSGNARLQLQGPQQDIAVLLDVDTGTSVRAHGNLDLTAAPPAGSLQGEVTGELLQDISGQVTPVSPLRFRLSGNTDFVEIHVTTDLQTARENLLAFELNGYAVLPGHASDTFNMTFDWNTESGQENALLTLSGKGEIDFRDAVLSIYHETATPFATQLAGDIDFATQPVLDIRLNWRNVRIPVAENRLLQAPSGYVNIAGPLNGLSVLARTRIAAVPANATKPMDDETGFTRIAIDGVLDITSDFLTGNLLGSVDVPVPAALLPYIKEPQPLQFKTTLGQDAIELAVTGAAQTAEGIPFDLSISGRMDTPSPAQESIAATVNWSITPTGDPENFKQLEGHGEVQFQKERLEISHNLLTPFQAKLDGNVAFFEDRESVLRFDLTWQDLLLPLQQTDSLQSERGQVHIEGPLSSLVITMQGRVQAPALGNVDLDVNANWSDPVLTFTQLNAAMLGGDVTGNGRVTLNDITSGRFDIDARNINLETINPDLVSRIDFTSKLDFSMEGEAVNGRLQVPSLSGKWRGYPLQGNADISRVANRTHIRSLHVESGQNTIDLQLELNELLAGYLDLSINDMSVFSSTLAGSVNGRFDIGGSTQAPRLDGNLRGENINAFDVHIETVEVDSLIDLRPQQETSLNVHALALRYDNWLLDSLTVNGRGLTDVHTIEMQATGKDLQLSAMLDGQLKDKKWLGLLRQLDINTARTGAWKLDRSSELAWLGDTRQFSLGTTCLVQDDASLCLAATADMNKDAEGSIQLVRLPLQLAQPWLPDTVSLDGTISGDVLLKQLQERWELQTDLQGANTQVSLGFEDDREILDVPKLSLTANITPLQRKWNLQLGSPEYFDISLAGSVENTGQQPVSADMKMELHQINWLAGIEPDLSGSEGKFNAHVRASGTIDRPQIEGQFNLAEGRLNIVPLGLSLDRISGELRSGTEKSQMLIRSMLGSGGRQLELDGYATLIAEQHYPYQLQVKGDSFPLIRTADITLDASPDLQLYGTTELHYVRGNVTIPLVDMQITSLPEDSVTVSPDTVIANSGGDADEKIRGNDFIRDQLDIDISMTLGPDIHIRGFGLDTRVAGDINVEKPAGIYQPRGEGFLNLSEGSYRAYGQDLVIDKGQLQFAGPLDNPGINVRAYRPNLKVKPGVLVRGNIRQPKLTLYSEPTLPETDTLSYLLTGRPITGASNEEASLLAQAALTLGTRESSVLAREIESMFGLEKFTVGAGQTYESTSISATKRLSPNLTFSPSFNPFNQLWTFILNYKLTEHWSVQTESGISQAGDIIYSIETNKVSELFRNIWTFD